MADEGRTYAFNEETGIVIMDARHSAIRPHTHSFYELVYIKSGFCLHETEGKTCLLVEGDFFLMKPGQYHGYTGSHVVELYNCLFQARAVNNEIKQLPGLNSKSDFVKLHLDLNGQRRVLRLINGIEAEQRLRETGWQYKARAMLESLLVDYAREYERIALNTSEKSVYSNYVVGALEIIASDYADADLSVAKIALRVGVSPDYLSRQMRQILGVGVQEYLRCFRFAKATEHLLGGRSVSETAQAVGFSNLCNFSREFKKELGTNPTQYVKQNAY